MTINQRHTYCLANLLSIQQRQKLLADQTTSKAGEDNLNPVVVVQGGEIS